MSSSPPPAFQSSPFSITSPRRIPKSNFTYKQLHQLKSFSPKTPLRVIAHVDLDCFYAQCESIRQGLDPSQPLAVQQWGGLIAINYAARAFGLTRFATSIEAVKACPDIKLQHVATWKEGEDKWAYHDDAFKEMATHKVSLDPYRMESRKILQCIKDFLPDAEQRVEKAGIDEVFLDLSAQVHTILLERYAELRGPAPYDDPTERLPKVPTTVLDWAADELVETGEEDGEDRDPDWDDVCLVAASEIVRNLRRHVKETLGYTCSGGVARNKMLSKLGSGYKKPNRQTVIRNRAIAHFLSKMKFTKIRMLGGKLGDEAVALFGTDKVQDLLEKPLEQLKMLGDESGTWLYGTLRGEDNSEVNPRTQIKSMLSAKSFRPCIHSFEQGVRWLRIFAADIFSRCVEEGVLENKRRPKSVNLHHRHFDQVKSRQAPIPQGKPLSEAVLFDLAKTLLAQIVVDGRCWPCANLSLSVAGFEDGITNNKGIGGFLVRGEEARAMMAGRQEGGGEEAQRPTKRRRTNGNIATFFGPKDDEKGKKKKKKKKKKRDLDAARAVLARARTGFIGQETGIDGDEPEYEDSAMYSHDVEEELDFRDQARTASPFHLTNQSQKGGDGDGDNSNNSNNHNHNNHDDDDNDDDDYNNNNKNPLYFSDAAAAAAPPSAQQPRLSSPSPTPASASASAPAPIRASVSAPVFFFFCPSCNIHLPLPTQHEHNDYHFALDMSKEMRQEAREEQQQQEQRQRQQQQQLYATSPHSRMNNNSNNNNTTTTIIKASGQKSSRGRGRPPGSAGGGGGGGGKCVAVEKGQARLAFGRE